MYKMLVGFLFKVNCKNKGKKKERENNKKKR